MIRVKREVLIVGGCVAVALLAVAAFHKWFGTAEAMAMAAWVQAIGAVGVIIATAWIANINFSEGRDHARQAERQLKESVAVLAASCLDRLDYVRDHIRDGANNRSDFMDHYTPSDFEAPMDGLAAIPLHELGDANLIAAVLDLWREMGRIKTGLDTFRTNLPDPRFVGALYNVQELHGKRTLIFNSMASIMRIVSPGAATEDRISFLASRAKGPLS